MGSLLVQPAEHQILKADHREGEEEAEIIEGFLMDVQPLLDCHSGNEGHDDNAECIEKLMKCQ